VVLLDIMKLRLGGHYGRDGVLGLLDAGLEDVAILPSATLAVEQLQRAGVAAQVKCTRRKWMKRLRVF